MSPHPGVRHTIERAAAERLERLFRTFRAADRAHRLGLQPRQVTVTTHRLSSAHLPAGLTLRVAFASDFHAGGVTSDALLEAACVALGVLEPDLLLLGGDYVSTRAEDAHRLAALLRQLTPRLGTYGVLGNHDYYAGCERVRELLEPAGVTVLRNRSVRLGGDCSDIWICGLDDHDEGAPDAERTCTGTAGFRIALMHSPEGVRDIAGRGVGLALCGHTHGGQIALPGGRPILLPRGRLVRTYIAGEYRMDDGGTLIVSRGVGCDFLPVRLFAPSEILLCEITGTMSTTDERRA